jgi:hypothetical protein
MDRACSAVPATRGTAAITHRSAPAPAQASVGYVA